MTKRDTTLILPEKQTFMPDIVYRRNLPHVHPDGYPLFITFRLAESLPIEILINLNKERESELNSASNTSELNDIEKRHFGRCDDWLDRCTSGPRWLEDGKIAGIVAEKISDLGNSRYKLFAYCIMSNHVHLLIEHQRVKRAEHGGKSAKYPVTETLRLLKGSTARYCNMQLKRTGSFWHHESYDHFVRNEGELEWTIRYILQNPVKAGLVNEWTSWRFTYVNPMLGEW